MNCIELNIDGLVGPTHHYAGLATGNIASKDNALTVANPKAAVMQGIAKMRFVHELGIKQAVFPPHERPNLTLLHALGFNGNLNQTLQAAYQQEPQLLAACFSAASMWAANSATVTASHDSDDQKVHFTAANLISSIHRFQETDFAQRLLRHYFADSKYFIHHPPLPSVPQFGDEGAANHARLCEHYGKSGVSLFVYGKHGLNKRFPCPSIYPARQTLEASKTIARSHRVRQCVFAQQRPDAIDAGVFHNDVVGLSNQAVYIYHQHSFLDTEKIKDELRRKADFDLQFIEVQEADLTLEQAVKSYLFNSQLLTLNNGDMAIIAPTECKDDAIMHYCKQLIQAENPIKHIHHVDVTQSMRNGGGPACLRLRVPLTHKEYNAMKQSVIIDSSLLQQLEQWAEKHYRDRLHLDDLIDPTLVKETQQALDELSQLLELGSIYSFQR